jgi:hypothetical protein
MFHFIIPLKSPLKSKDWNTVSNLFQRCVRSISAQTNKNFRIIVVGNEIPKVITVSPIEILPLQVQLKEPDDNIDCMDMDKAKKILCGVELAETLGASYCMPVDADDLISNRIVDYVASANLNEQAPGWLLSKGYVYPEGGNILYYRRKKFMEICGTSAIFHVREKENFFYEVPWRTNPEKNYLRYNKDKPKGNYPNLPFAGAVYSIFNGENFFLNKNCVNELKSGNKKIAFYARKISKYFPIFLNHKLKKEFSLKDLSVVK